MDEVKRTIDEEISLLREEVAVLSARLAEIPVDDAPDDARSLAVSLSYALRGAKSTLNGLLYACGRGEEVDPGVYNGAGAVVALGFRESHLHLLGHDRQILVGLGRDGDVFLSLKPAPVGQGAVLVRRTTRYVGIEVFCGPFAVLDEILSHHALNTADVGGKLGGSLFVPLAMPFPGVAPTIHVAAARVGVRLSVLGHVSDGWIRWSPAAVLAAMTYHWWEG